MAITLTQTKTAADYARLGEGAPVQLIAGEFIMSPSPLIIHQRIAFHLARLLDDFVRAGGLGEVFVAPADVHLSEGDVYQPDVFFISNLREKQIESNGVYGAPDLVIEILSPSTAHYDLKDKKDAYEKFGVLEYWIVDPHDKSVEAFQSKNGKFETFFLGKQGKPQSSILPGFSVKVEEIFSRA